MVPSIFMMQTASTCTGPGSIGIITTCHTRTIGEIHTLMSTAMQTAVTAAATVPKRHPTHRSSIEASKSTPSFLLRTKSYSRLPSQHLIHLLRNKYSKESLLNPRSHLPQFLMSTDLPSLASGARAQAIPMPITH
jgi:hypothetical protein